MDGICGALSAAAAAAAGAAGVFIVTTTGLRLTGPQVSFEFIRNCFCKSVSWKWKTLTLSVRNIETTKKVNNFLGKQIYTAAHLLVWSLTCLFWNRLSWPNEPLSGCVWKRWGTNSQVKQGQHSKDSRRNKNNSTQWKGCCLWARTAVCAAQPVKVCSVCQAEGMKHDVRQPRGMSRMSRTCP